MKESVQPKRKRSDNDAAGRLLHAILHPPTVGNSLLQVDTQELCKEENHVIAVAYLQRIN